MRHPLFGEIEYYDDDPNQWEGQVKVPFFAQFECPPVLIGGAPRSDGERSLYAEVQEKRKQGLFTLFILDQAGRGPSQAQERAFVHFMENQNAICAAVAAALFQYYQDEYQALRQTCSLFRNFDAILPPLQRVDGLKKLIQFGGLSLLEGMGLSPVIKKPAIVAKANNCSLIGFPFGCAWDEEHGLGVLVHRDKIVEVGGNDVTWNGPRLEF